MPDLPLTLRPDWPEVHWFRAGSILTRTTMKPSRNSPQDTKRNSMKLTTCSKCKECWTTVSLTIWSLLGSHRKGFRAARRVNDLPTAIRVFEALKYKVENEDQYKAYLDELKDVRKELGVPLKEELFPSSSWMSWKSYPATFVVVSSVFYYLWKTSPFGIRFVFIL